MTNLIIYLAAVVLGVLLGLKAFDAARAWRYNRRMAHLRAVVAAYEIGKRFAMGVYGDSEVRVQSFIVRTTPDRPADPYMARVKAEIEGLLGGQP